MTFEVPQSTKAIVIQKSLEKRNPVYDDAVLVEQPIPPLKKGQVLVKTGAVAFNHKDVWIRMRQYPGILQGATLGAEGAGTVVASADPSDPLLANRVFLTPMRGWESHPGAPETNFGILGGCKFPSLGTFSEYVVVERDQVIPTPGHLNDVQAAAWPLGGLTAWRAVVVNAQVKNGDNVLITGIGGGVALQAMQICLVEGANVYVTSGSEEKIKKAVELGAKGGVNYKSKGWGSRLAGIVKETSPKAAVDTVIDSGGDAIMEGRKVLKQGGKIVCYGMTANRQIPFTMHEVLKNQQLIGSTMGSRKDLIEATNFITEHRLVPIVSHVIDGLENAEEGFQLMKRGEQFGKIVIRLGRSGKAKL